MTPRPDPYPGHPFAYRLVLNYAERRGQNMLGLPLDVPSVRAVGTAHSFLGDTVLGEQAKAECAGFYGALMRPFGRAVMITVSRKVHE